MSVEQIYSIIEETGIVAVMRGRFGPDVAVPLVGTLLEEDIQAFEFTMNSDQPIEAMRAVKKEYGEDAIVGMGTVLDLDSARRVLDAGADFVVSPVFQPEIVELVRDAGIFMAPGVTTPTEAIQAWSMNVPMLKLFPIGALGTEYFKALFGPLDHMKFMCNGAMNDQNAQAFVAAGAVAVGMGGWLTGDGTWPDSRLRSRARLLQNAIRTARGDAPIQEI